MNEPELTEVLRLRGIPFLKALLEMEERRFEGSQFLKGSTFEEINTDFGLFPSARAYPVYFAGDVANPVRKKIFVGINPGYSNSPRQAAEQEYLEHNGSYDGYRRIFVDFFARHQSGLLPYYANIAGFIRLLDGIDHARDWNWLQDNLINLDLIPYHSSDAQGLRIQKPGRFRQTYFEIFLRILDHLSPTEPIFFNGFPTLKKYLDEPQFQDVMKYEPQDGFHVGTIAGKFKFLGLPFLNRPAGGKKALVDKIKRYYRSLK